MRVLIGLLLLHLTTSLSGQSYTSFFTGNSTDITSDPKGGICLMGGATEDDNAMRWFLEQADGGDILVLRASGSDGYNDYLYSQLGVNVNSVETILFEDATANNDPYILDKISRAEGIWFAGGDQWKYISYWRNSPIDSLLNIAINERNIVIGGTSAGMAIQGQYYFSAEVNTVTSDEALANPFNSFITVDSTTFINNTHLQSVITDTHFDNPDRRGRLVSFLARIYHDYGVSGKAIACDEYTAVCISPDGMARVFGAYPEFEDNAYFIQSNCALSDFSPEVLSEDTPLTWNHNNEALKVYRIQGESTGTSTFDLNDWKTGTGGEWLHWSVDNGQFSEEVGTPVDCEFVSNENIYDNKLNLFPNPASNWIDIKADQSEIKNHNFSILDINGKVLNTKMVFTTDSVRIDLSEYSAGIYYLKQVDETTQVISIYKIAKL